MPYSKSIIIGPSFFFHFVVGGIHSDPGDVSQDPERETKAACTA